MTAPHLTEILLLAAHGLQAFPCWRTRDGRCPCHKGAKCTSPGKHPIADGWQQQATADPDKLREMFERFPGRNVGVACGMISGVIVVDIDPRHEGDESLAELERINEPLPSTWEVMTGGGGRHLYFRHPGAGRIPNSAGVLGPGIDIRGDGGLVVAPPSIHASSRAYAWSVDHHPDDQCLAELPDWIVARLDRPHLTPAATAEEWRATVIEMVPEGRRNQHLAKLAGHLLRRRVDPYFALDLLRGWNALHCQPPLDDEEVVTTVKNIADRELRRRCGHAA